MSRGLGYFDFFSLVVSYCLYSFCHVLNGIVSCSSAYSPGQPCGQLMRQLSSIHTGLFSHSPRPAHQSHRVSKSLHTAHSTQDYWIQYSQLCNLHQGETRWLVVSLCFEPSQPQPITSGLEQTSICFLFAHKSSNHKFSKNYKISPDTIYRKQNIHKHQIKFSKN